MLVLLRKFNQYYAAHTTQKCYVCLQTVGDMRYSAERISDCYWRVFLCPRFIQVMAIQLRNVVNVVGCRCPPPLPGIVGIVGCKMHPLSQIMPVGNCHFLPMRHGVEVNHRQHRVMVNLGNSVSMGNQDNLEALQPVALQEVLLYLSNRLGISSPSGRLQRHNRPLMLNNLSGRSNPLIHRQHPYNPLAINSLLVTSKPSTRRRYLYNPLAMGISKLSGHRASFQAPTIPIISQRLPARPRSQTHHSRRHPSNRSISRLCLETNSLQEI